MQQVAHCWVYPANQWAPGDVAWSTRLLGSDHLAGGCVLTSEVSTQPPACCCSLPCCLERRGPPATVLLTLAFIVFALSLLNFIALPLSGLWQWFTGMELAAYLYLCIGVTSWSSVLFFPFATWSVHGAIVGLGCFWYLLV